MEKLGLLYEGKAKKVFVTDDPDILIVDYKDDATAFNGLKKGTIVGKGVIKFEPIFAELKRQNFSGMFSIEHESKWYNSVPDVIETVKLYNDEVGKLK